MADWATIASLATAGGTLVLAFATFAAVRSSNRSARLAEDSIRIGIRPLLVSSRLEDPPQQLIWVDEHLAEIGGAEAHVQIDDDVVYLAMSLRNAGSGIGVIQGWHLWLERLGSTLTRPDPSVFHPQTRDLYVPAGDLGFWQAAVRDVDDPARPALVDAIRTARVFGVELLYTDHQGEQPTISFFTVRPEAGRWSCAAVRHWNLDRPDPR
jgi:hypothetical protein